MRAGLDSVARGAALVSTAGRLLWATPSVEAWLAAYFPTDAGASTLPLALHAWLLAQHGLLAAATDAPRPPQPFTAEAARGRLSVQYGGSTSDGRELMLTFVEARPLPSVAQLAALGLRQREAEVLRLVVEGLRDREIAARLGDQRAHGE